MANVQRIDLRWWRPKVESGDVSAASVPMKAVDRLIQAGRRCFGLRTTATGGYQIQRDYR